MGSLAAAQHLPHHLGARADLANTSANNGSGQAWIELERRSSRKVAQQPSLAKPDRPGQS
jgi:hypothetical protein